MAHHDEQNRTEQNGTYLNIPYQNTKPVHNTQRLTLTAYLKEHFTNSLFQFVSYRITLLILSLP